MKWIDLVFDISFPIILTLAPLCYLLFQFSKKKFHIHWAGVLSYAWCFCSFYGFYCYYNHKHNLTFYQAVGIISILTIINFSSVKISKTIKLVFASLVILSSVVFLILLDNTASYYIRQSWNNMIIMLLAVIYMVISLYKLIRDAEEDDLFLSSEFWISIGFLCYYFFMLYAKLFSSVADFPNIYPLSIAVLLFGNGITSFFLIMGFKQWARNLS